jgi:hypothetical protein
VAIFQVEEAGALTELADKFNGVNTRTGDPEDVGFPEDGVRSFLQKDFVGTLPINLSEIPVMVVVTHKQAVFGCIISCLGVELGHLVVKIERFVVLLSLRRNSRDEIASSQLESHFDDFAGILANRETAMSTWSLEPPLVEVSLEFFRSEAV